MMNEYSYKLYYGSTLLTDSSTLDDYYETEEEAREEAEIEGENRIDQWKLDDAWHEWNSVEEFDIVIEEREV